MSRVPPIMHFQSDSATPSHKNRPLVSDHVAAQFEGKLAELRGAENRREVEKSEQRGRLNQSRSFSMDEQQSVCMHGPADCDTELVGMVGALPPVQYGSSVQIATVEHINTGVVEQHGDSRQSPTSQSTLRQCNNIAEHSTELPDWLHDSQKDHASHGRQRHWTFEIPDIHLETDAPGFTRLLVRLDEDGRWHVWFDTSEISAGKWFGQQYSKLETQLQAVGVSLATLKMVLDRGVEDDI